MLGRLYKAIISIPERFAEWREARRLTAERLAQQEVEERQKAQHEQWVLQKLRERELQDWLASLPSPNRASHAERLAEGERAAEEFARKEAETARKQEIEELRHWFNPFKVGERYENCKGTFTVIALSQGKMRIRWDTGEEITDTVDSQARIFRNIQRELRGEHAFSSRDLRICARCGAYIYEDNANYFDGKVYGSTCIKRVRGYS